MNTLGTLTRKGIPCKRLRVLPMPLSWSDLRAFSRTMWSGTRDITAFNLAQLLLCLLICPVYAFTRSTLVRLPSSNSRETSARVAVSGLKADRCPDRCRKTNSSGSLSLCPPKGREYTDHLLSMLGPVHMKVQEAS